MHYEICARFLVRTQRWGNYWPALHELSTTWQIREPRPMERTVAPPEVYPAPVCQKALNFNENSMVKRQREQQNRTEAKQLQSSRNA